MAQAPDGGPIAALIADAEKAAESWGDKASDAPMVLLAALIAATHKHDAIEAVCPEMLRNAHTMLRGKRAMDALATVRARGAA